jgi:hypothetical protein
MPPTARIDTYSGTSTLGQAHFTSCSPVPCRLDQNACALPESRPAGGTTQARSARPMSRSVLSALYAPICPPDTPKASHHRAFPLGEAPASRCWSSDISAAHQSTHPQRVTRVVLDGGWRRVVGFAASAGQTDKRGVCMGLDLSCEQLIFPRRMRRNV